MTTTVGVVDAGWLSLAHLLKLTDARGLFEHADHDEPRLEHGYCVDDVARALTFVVRESRIDADAGDETSPSAETLAALTETYLTFVEGAIAPNGSMCNRMNKDGDWTDKPAGGDWWGRGVGALGVAAAHSPDAGIRSRAASALVRASAWQPRDLRARLFAAIGAAEVFASEVPEVSQAARLLLAPVPRLLDEGTSAWPWPEPRLRYANGAIAEALMCAGVALGNTEALDRGVFLLDFLIQSQTIDGGLSLVGHGGRGPGDRTIQFDQQSIEAATLAEACTRAYLVTGRERYRDEVATACRWFLGENDSHTPMVDLFAGAGFDGLEAKGRNSNRGAESTLAALTTFQCARRLGLNQEIL